MSGTMSQTQNMTKIGAANTPSAINGPATNQISPSVALCNPNPIPQSVVKSSNDRTPNRIRLGLLRIGSRHRLLPFIAQPMIIRRPFDFIAVGSD
jgi:hypothetical protein